jgi:Fic family protein
MDPRDFTNPTAGRLVRTSRGAAAFVPSPLPPPLEPTWNLVSATTRAQAAVGNLRGVGRTLPNPHLLIQPFARREAVLSSRIEGTEASVSDLLLFEVAPKPAAGQTDVPEVANYIEALNLGLGRLSEIPLSLRFIREVHERLLRGVRGATRAPGEFRRDQNWIGSPGATIETAMFVPPPVPEMHEALDALEKYFHADSELPPLIRIALIHYQFETIHPFLDGNGRVGRLLITFLFQVWGLLDQPLLYLSAFFERHREDYYTLLDAGRRGKYAEWVLFFLRAVEDQANDAVARANRLLELRDDYRRRVTAARSSALLAAAVDHLFETPALTVVRLRSLLGVTHRAAQMNMQKLVSAGIVTEPPEGRNRVYLAEGILALVEA